MARTSGRSANASMKSSSRSSVWFPAETMKAKGTSRWLMVKSDDSMPLWVMMAAPYPGQVPPWANGHSATLST